MVEWIEMDVMLNIGDTALVSTLVVEWIEIVPDGAGYPGYSVSTLVVEWIEINQPQ